MPQRLNHLIHREVSRKEFLGLVALALGSIFGLGPLIKLLTGHTPASNQHAAQGYGSTAYGDEDEA